MRNLTFSIFLITAMAIAAYAGEPNVSVAQPESASGAYGERPGSSYLGVDTRDITPGRASELKLKQEIGVEVTMVDQDAPAGKAGVREGDVIMSLNGTPMESVEQLRRMIREIPPGRTVTLGILRNGRSMTLKAQLANRQRMYALTPALPEMPGEPVHVEVPNIEIPAMPAFDIPAFDVIVHSASRGGMMVENLTPQLGDYFGVKNGQGVLVRSVEKNSPAERAGLRAGDVVIKVGEHRIADTSDWRNAMRVHRSGTVPLSILRDRKPQTLTLQLSRQVGQSTAHLDPTMCAGVNMSAVELELRRMQPQIERAAADAQLKIARLTPQIQKAQIEASKEAERRIQQQQKQIQRALEQAARRAQTALQQHRKQLEKLQQQMRAFEAGQEYI
jgi:membrane-associated protease RseP (regulator of RpoE activity)